VWFQRKDKLSDVPPHLRSGEMPGAQKPAFYRIEFDMMKKGAILQRRGKPIRQFAVTVNMSTRVVTSGDVVDRETFEALVAAGAVDRAPDTSARTKQGGANDTATLPSNNPSDIEE